MPSQPDIASASKSARSTGKAGEVARLVIAALVLAVAVLAAMEAAREIGPVIRDPRSDRLRVSALIAGNVMVPGASTYSHNAVLRACLETITSVRARLLPSDQRESLLDSCAQSAEAIVWMNPASGFAWYLLGHVSTIRGDAGAAVLALERSYRFSAEEYWLARLRGKLVEEAFDLLGTGTATFHAHDLALMINGELGRSELARQYLLRVESRPRLAATIQTLDNDLQARFLAEVRKQGDRVGSR